jgi:hypothetical protein
MLAGTLFICQGEDQYMGEIIWRIREVIVYEVLIVSRPRP